MSAHIKARSSRLAARSAGRVSNGKTTCASTDVVNACGGEGEGESTIQPQRSHLHYIGNTLQSVKGDLFKIVTMFHCKDVTILTFGASLLLHNSTRASSLTPPEWDIAMFC